MTEGQGEPGRPGKPGQHSTGATGGAGGAGGAGGRGGASEGDVAGGVGGVGGAGGAGEPGGQGERGTFKHGGTMHDRRRKAYWKQRGVIPRWQLIAVYLTIVTAGIAGFAATTRTAHKANDAAREARTSARQVALIAHRADDLAREIQAQRVRTARENCATGNMRHDNVDKVLDRQIARAKTAQERAQVKQRKAVVVPLLEALQPHQDCARAVRQATGGG